MRMLWGATPSFLSSNVTAAPAFTVRSFGSKKLSLRLTATPPLGVPLGVPCGVGLASGVGEPVAVLSPRPLWVGNAKARTNGAHDGGKHEPDERLPEGKFGDVKLHISRASTLYITERTLRRQTPPLPVLYSSWGREDAHAYRTPEPLQDGPPRRARPRGQRPPRAKRDRPRAAGALRPAGAAAPGLREPSPAYRLRPDDLAAAHRRHHDPGPRSTRRREGARGRHGLRLPGRAPVAARCPRRDCGARPGAGPPG